MSAPWTSPRSHGALGVVGWVSALPIQCSFRSTPMDEVISSQVRKTKGSSTQICRAMGCSGS